MVLGNLTGILGGLGEVGVGIGLDTTGQEGLGEVHGGGTLAGTAVFSGHVPGKDVISSLQIRDDSIVNLFARSTVVSEVRGLCIFEDHRNGAEEFSQTEVGKTTEEVGFRSDTGLFGLAAPLDGVNLAEGEVGIGSDLVELVPKALRQVGGGRPGSGEVAHVGVGTQLILVVRHVRTRGHVVRKTLAKVIREIQFLEFIVTGKERIENLVALVEGIGDRQLGFRLFGEEFVIRHAGNGRSGQKRDTDKTHEIFIGFHFSLQC